MGSIRKGSTSHLLRMELALKLQRHDKICDIQVSEYIHLVPEEAVTEVSLIR
jgi:hypothetical protein